MEGQLRGNHNRTHQELSIIPQSTSPITRNICLSVNQVVKCIWATSLQYIPELITYRIYCKSSGLHFLKLSIPNDRLSSIWRHLFPVFLRLFNITEVISLKKAPWLVQPAQRAPTRPFHPALPPTATSPNHLQQQRVCLLASRARRARHRAHDVPVPGTFAPPKLTTFSRCWRCWKIVMPNANTS
jgi:hypothetical protein